MNLDPTASPWLGVLAATGVCLWMAAIGAPLAHAVFRHRPRFVWPFYAPILGVVAVLLTTNLSAYLIPGAASAWFGLLAPSALSAAIAWRSGAIRRLSRRSALALSALMTVSAGLFVVSLASRTQVRHGDEIWHYALAARMARGVFPPETPYGVDAGIGYHYGHNLLAAGVVSVTGAPAWTSFVVLGCLLAVALMLAAVGFAWDLGAPLPLAVGVGAAIGLWGGEARIGVPLRVEDFGPAEAPVFLWTLTLQRTLAVGVVILVAAALQAGAARRSAAAMAAGAGGLRVSGGCGPDLLQRGSGIGGRRTPRPAARTRPLRPGRGACGRRAAGRAGRRPCVRCALWARRHGRYGAACI